MKSSLHCSLILASLLLSLTLSSASLAKQTMFKWIDEQGVTHYSHQRPNQQPVETVNITNGKTTTLAPDNTDQIDNTDKPVPISVAPVPTSTKNSNKCQLARKYLEQLSSQPRVRTQDPNTQEWRFLTPTEIDNRRDESKQQIELYCN